MASQWYIERAGDEEGPVSFQRLALLVHEHRVAEDHLVRRSDSAEWTPAHRVAGLLHTARRLGAFSRSPVANVVSRPVAQSRSAVHRPSAPAVRRIDESPDIGRRVLLVWVVVAMTILAALAWWGWHSDPMRHKNFEGGSGVVFENATSEPPV